MLIAALQPRRGHFAKIGSVASGEPGGVMSSIACMGTVTKLRREPTADHPS